MTRGQRFITPHDLGLGESSTVRAPDGGVYVIGTSRWDELRSDWRVTDVGTDPFQNNVKGRTYTGAGGMVVLPFKEKSAWSSERDSPSALIYSLRARAGSDALEEYLLDVGRHITVALHYKRRVIGEVNLSRLLREEYLLGVPLILFPHFTFGVLVVPEKRFRPPADDEHERSSVELALAGFLFESSYSDPEKDMLAQRYEELTRLSRR